MKKFLCWLFDHDRMTTSTRHRVCLRCGMRETLRYFGDVLAWEEMTSATIRGSRVSREPAVAELRTPLDTKPVGSRPRRAARSIA